MIRPRQLRQVTDIWKEGVPSDIFKKGVANYNAKVAHQ